MIVVGLTGSIAMGKTTVAQMFAALGIPVFDSDAEVHRQYARGCKAAGEIAKHFPDVIAQGAVDRQALSRVVLNNPAALQTIEAIVHPIVRQRQIDFLDRCRRQHRPVAILDIPLLFETHRETDVDRIVVVSAPAGLQRQRALRRPGMTEAKLEQILARQTPDGEKRARADFVVDTSQSLDYTREQVVAIVASLRRHERASPQ